VPECCHFGVARWMLGVGCWTSPSASLPRSPLTPRWYAVMPSPVLHHSTAPPFPGRSGAGLEVQCRKSPDQMKECHPDVADHEKGEPLAVTRYPELARAGTQDGKQAERKHHAAGEVLEEICGPGHVHDGLKEPRAYQGAAPMSRGGGRRATRGQSPRIGAPPAGAQGGRFG
jgi:hypothetical protein